MGNVDIAPGGAYEVMETFEHQGQVVGVFLSESTFRIRLDGEIVNEIPVSEILEAPLGDLVVSVLGQVPASEIALRIFQLTMALQVAETVDSQYFKVTIVGKEVDEVQEILADWRLALENAYKRVDDGSILV